MVRLATVWLTMAALLTGAAAAAAVNVRIDRQTIPVTDSLRVVFIADEQTARPDFSPLEKDFELLGTSQSTSVNIINGRMQTAVSWTVELMPRRTGELTIPPIDFGGQSSPARKVTVTPAAAGGDADGEVFLEVEVNPATPYVQAHTRFTVRVFRAVNTSEASLTEPELVEGDAVIERLGDDIAYETNRGGTRFSVVERRYSIFPQGSGKIVIAPLVFAGRVAATGRMFDPFARGRVVRVRSDQIEIEVLPIPAGFTGQVWLPAERVDLTEEWAGETAGWRAGEPLTRTLTLRARGLTASQLPEIEMPLPDGLRQYRDQPQLDTRAADVTQLATRVESVAIIPSRAGDFTFPAMEIPWWNTVTDTLEFARLPERTVRVLPAAVAPPVAETPAPVAAPGADADFVANDARDAAASVEAEQPWKWISASLAVLWLVTVAGWWWSRRKIPVVTGQKTPRTAPGKARTALRQACAASDAPAATAALLQWAADHWPGSPVHSLGELAARVDGPLQDEVHRLSRTHYRPDSGPWQGEALWRAFQSYKPAASESPQRESPHLEPLYRA